MAIVPLIQGISPKPDQPAPWRWHVGIPLIERIKIQAQVLVPLVKALQAELGEPELGFLLVCSQDFTFAEGLGPDIKLTRTQTIMQGASHCDFRYRRQKD